MPLDNSALSDMQAFHQAAEKLFEAARRGKRAIAKLDAMSVPLPNEGIDLA